MRDRFILLTCLLVLVEYTKCDNFKFTLSLVEKPSEDDPSVLEYATFSVDMTCGNKNCDYSITLTNFGFYKILVNNKECPNSLCDNYSFNRGQTVNVTVLKTPDIYLKLFDFEYVINPNIVILGCEYGFYNDKTCTRMTQNLYNFDEVCLCVSTGAPASCHKDTNQGYCQIGDVSWWHSYSDLSSTSTVTHGPPTPPVIWNYSIDDVTVTLTENGENLDPNENKTIIVSAFLNCTVQGCQYKSTVTNYNPGYYTFTVGNDGCSTLTCSGTFLKGQTAPVTIHRKNQRLEILTYQWTSDAPEVIVLGCESGLLLYDTCLTTYATPIIDNQQYNDVVCSCQGAKMKCDPFTQQGVCIGGTPVWWTDETDSTFSTPTSISTTTFPPEDPLKFDVTFYLAEGIIDGNPINDNNVTILANMNCTETQCNYSVRIVEYAQTYYKILVNGQECPGSHCQGLFTKHTIIPIHVTRISEIVNLFDLEYSTTPNIRVLGCTYGMVDYGSCRSAQYYDDIIQKDDTLCICRSAKMECDTMTQPGSCSDGDPVWWKSVNDGTSSTVSTSTVSTSTVTTSEPPYSKTFDFSLFEMDNGVAQRISFHVILSCQTGCDFTIEVKNDAISFFSVSLDNGMDCQTNCHGSIAYNEMVKVSIDRVGGGTLDFFDLKYKDVVVLGCSKGWVVPGKCVLSSHGDSEMCSCEDTDVKCEDVADGVCSEGTPVWWKSTSDGTSSTSSTPSLSMSTTSMPSSTTTSFSFVTTFTIQFSESTDTDHQKISIETTLRCPDSACTFDIEISDNPLDYFSVAYDNVACISSCRDSFFQTQTVHVYLHKANGDKLDIFDLKFKEVVVLGCASGWLEDGQCLRVTNGKDEMCSCKDTDTACGGAADAGDCIDGTPTWWQPDPAHHSSSTFATTSIPTMSTKGPYTTSFDISLYETTDSGPQSISIHTTLTCTETMCSYKITSTKSTYFSVYIDKKDCPETCQSSYNFVETVPVYVEKLGGQERLDLFDMKFKNVVVLGCDYGWLVPGKCVKAKNGEDEMCSCQDIGGYCFSLDDYSACNSGDPLWWQANPDYTPPTTSSSTSMSTISPGQYTQVTATLQENLKTDPSNYKEVQITAAMNCSRKICDYGTTVDNKNPEYYTVLRDGVECPAPCHGTLAHGDPSIVFSVHRLEQHLDFVEFQFTDAPTILVMGCEAMRKDGSVFIEQEDDAQCVHIFEDTVDEVYHDDVCLCKGSGLSCGNEVPIAKCSSGSVTWWQNDFSSSTSTVTSTTTTVPTTTVTTTPSTTTVTTTPTTTTVPTTTTTTVPRNQFSYEISLAEGRNNRKNQVNFSSEMSCDLEKCDFSIKVDNSAQTWFKVYVGSEECQNKKCSGQFPVGHGVNVTVYRGTQMLDLFDFEYTDLPRIAVLGCENGLADYGSCTRITKAVQVEGQDFVDEICSCRSEKLDCKLAREGICRGGSQTWWRAAPVTTTTGASTTTVTETTTVTPTTPPVVPSLQDLSNGGVDLNNVTQVLNDTEHYSKQGMALNHTQIFDITKILHNSANLPGISMENAKQILQNMDQCLNAHKEAVRRGQSREYRLLSILRPMVMNTKDTVIQYLDGKNLGFNAKKVNCNTENHTDDGLIDYGRDIGFAPLNDTNRLSSTSHNSIIVPLGTLCDDGQEVSHVFFTIFRGQKLFRGTQAYRSYGKGSEEGSDMDEVQEEFRQRWKRDVQGANQTDNVPQVPAPSRCITQPSIPNVPVMSATLMTSTGSVLSNYARMMGSDAGGEKIYKPATMARLQFNTGNLPRPLHGQKIVTWFDEPRQEWALQEQCKVEEDSNGVVTASCEHLTDFTVLIYGQLDAEQVCSWPLIIIGYSVNGASIFCLLLLIVIGLMFYIQTEAVRKILSYVRGQAQTSGDIINLAYYCIFLMFFVLSLFFMDQSSGGNEDDGTTTYCVIIAAMSYFSLISAIMMSMLIGIRMICHFFSPKLRAFFGVMTSPPAALSIGVIIPFSLTLILALLEREFFERNDAFCWVRPDYIAYAVIVPVILPIINGTICSSFAIYKMFFQAKRGLKNKETSHYDAEFWSKVLGLIIMQFAMGLPWGIEFILIGVAGSSAWNYIFVILLGTQGIDLFLIFLYRRQRLVNESRKWSAREEKLSRSQKSRARTRTVHDVEAT